MTSQFQHGYALIIGVDEHSNPQMALPTVKKDVDALYQLLINSDRCGYLAANVKLIHGKAATKQGIESGLSWLFEKVADDPASTVIIYYSGHGMRTEENKYFLVPYDVDSLRLLPIRGIAAEQFAETIALINPPRLMVVLDCCYAGGIEAKGGAFPIDTGVNEKSFIKGSKAVDFSPLQVGGGRFILNSSTNTETSLIRADGKMSVFTYHLIDALNGKGRSHDDTTVLVTDVIQHVVRTVPESAAQHNNHSQHPYIRTEGVGFPLALLRGGKGLAKGEDAPEPLADPVVQSAATQLIQTGSGAVAIGDHAVAAGERGVAVGGDMSGSTIITGDSNRIDRSSNTFNQSGQKVYGGQTNVSGDVGQIGNRYNRVDTGGGAYIGGSVNAGGDFVGRDKVVHGDEVRGDKISVGNISGSSGIAIGRNASASVTNAMNEQDAAMIAQLFGSIYESIEQSSLQPPIQAVMKQQVAIVENEAGKGPATNAEVIENALVVIQSMSGDLFQSIVFSLANSNLPIASIAARLRLRKD